MCVISDEDSQSKKYVSSILDKNVSGSVKKIIHFKETDSTNNRAKFYAESGEADGTLFVADSQTGGKGRRGRGWMSSDDSGLWMTLLLRPKIKADKASGLTLVAALAVVDAVENIVKGSEVIKQVPQCKIKWPNDIVLNRKKICGILTEMSADSSGVNYVVIGIGINLNIKSFDDSIKDKATSIFIETNESYTKESIIEEFSKAFERYYNIFLETCDLSKLINIYNDRLINIGKQVKILDADRDYTGKALGIDESGALLVEMDDGSKTAVVAGEVSVRGLYGYV